VDEVPFDFEFRPAVVPQDHVAVNISDLGFQNILTAEVVG
jgi:hypothetical protein